MKMKLHIMNIVEDIIRLQSVIDESRGDFFEELEVHLKYKQSRYFSGIRELNDYVMRLPLEDVKELIALKELGRDYYVAYTVEGSRPEYYRDNISGQELYRVVRGLVDEIKAEDRKVEAEELLSGQVRTHIERGLEIVGS